VNPSVCRGPVASLAEPYLEAEGARPAWLGARGGFRQRKGNAVVARVPARRMIGAGIAGMLSN